MGRYPSYTLELYDEEGSGECSSRAGSETFSSIASHLIGILEARNTREYRLRVSNLFQDEERIARFIINAHNARARLNERV